MTDQKPAIPAPAATPGNAQQNNNQNPPVTTPPANPGPGDNQVGKVTITTEEFAKLQRDAARARSADRRANLHRPTANPTLPGDPDAARAIQEANDRAAEAERKAMQFQAKDKVRELLEKDEFKSLPKSTKAVILENPAAFSSADNLEEALLDIEDLIRDKMTLDIGIPSSDSKNQPAGHDTPPVITPGAPEGNKPGGPIDTSKLRGTERSIGTIKNLISQKRNN